MRKKRPAITAQHIVNKFFPNVTEVNDADKPLFINVEEIDVKNSKRKDHNNCAMAEAAKRELAIKGAIISRSMAYLIKGNVATRYYLPEAIRREVTSFDRGGSFELGEYKMEAPPKSKKLGHLTGGHTKHKNRGSNPKRFVHITTGIRTSIKDKQ